MPQPPQESDNYSLNALQQQRRTARKWGLIVLVAGLAIGALVAPKITLLVFTLLAIFGVAGAIVSFGLRAFARWFDRPRG